MSFKDEHNFEAGREREGVDRRLRGHEIGALSLEQLLEMHLLIGQCCAAVRPAMLVVRG